MKLIRISTELELSVHEFPKEDYGTQNNELRKLIGDKCDLYEHVMPKRLYTELHISNRPSNTPGQCVSMLIDEEGLVKDGMTPNIVGSYLYETDKHGTPIMGNILLVGEEWGDDGIDFCGIEKSVFENLELQLKNMVTAFKATKEALKL